MFKNTVKTLLETCLKEREDLFLINFEVTEANAIKIIIDGDNGVLVEDCMLVSRAIEHNLDREVQDFSLEVASAGASLPLKQHRQYKKNLGRTLEVKTVHNTAFEAKLVSANSDGITLQWKAREAKPIGKGKITVQKEQMLLYKDIVEAKVKIKF